MRKENFEIIFNNSVQRQILILPETPLRIAFFFAEKELVLREKNGREGVYVISHQRGFTETDPNDESEQELEVTSEDNDNLSDGLTGIAAERYEESPGVVSLERPSLDVSAFKRCVNSVQSLNDKQLAEEDALYPVILPNRKQNIMTKGVKDNLKIPAVCGKIVCEKPGELVTQSKLIKKHIKPATEQIRKENSQEKKHQSVVITEQNHTEIRSDSSNKPKNNEIERAGSSEEDDDMIIDMEVSWSDDSVDEQDDINMLEKDKIKLTPKNARTHQSRTMPQQNKSDVQSKSCNSTEMHTHDQIERTHKDLESNLSDESVDDPGNVDGPQRESFPTSETSVSRSESNQMCDIQNDQDSPEVANETSIIRETKQFEQTKQKQKCTFCLKRRQKLHRFPKCCEISNMWAKASNKKYVIESTLAERRKKFFVCANHFTPRDYRSPKGVFLKWCAVPTQNLPQLSQINSPVPQDKSVLETMKSKLKMALQKSRPRRYQKPLFGKPKVTTQDPLSNSSPTVNCEKTLPEKSLQKPSSNLLLSPVENSGNAVQKTVVHQLLLNPSSNRNSKHTLLNLNSKTLPNRSPNVNSGSSVQKITLQQLLLIASSNKHFGDKMPKITHVESSSSTLPKKTFGNEVKKITQEKPSSDVN